MRGGVGVNKKLARLLEPGMGLYFLVLLLFAVAAVWSYHKTNG